MRFRRDFAGRRGDVPTLAEDGPNDLPAMNLLADGLSHRSHRLAAWGLALGVFGTDDDALAFAGELDAIAALGWMTPDAEPSFGARLHPLVPDPAMGPPLQAAARAPAAPSFLDERLAGVRDAVRRCVGDPAACADPLVN
ncbi:MAG: hypothetical protein JOZ27_07580, partial [Caulobacteraceae bacterium]|nr:hypothetical protein [Caulobacteraceae bacterium]